jgi:hypothetical protein
MGVDFSTLLKSTPITIILFLQTGKTVSKTVHGLDLFGVGRVVFELRSEPAHVNI